MDSFDLWVSDETVGTQTHVRVRNTETGAIGYRRLSWHGTLATSYGPVYTRAHCTTEAALLANFDGCRHTMARWLAENPWHQHAEVIWDGQLDAAVCE